MRDKRHWKPNVKEKVSIWKNSKGTKINNGSIYIQTNHLPANERFDFRHQMITSTLTLSTTPQLGRPEPKVHTYRHRRRHRHTTGDNQGNHQINQSTMKTSTFNCRSLGREREGWQTKKSFQNWSQSHGLRLIRAKKNGQINGQTSKSYCKSTGSCWFLF